MKNFTSNGDQSDDDGTVNLPSEDDFDDLSSQNFLKNAPIPRARVVDLRQVPASKRHSYEFVAEMSGFSVEKIKSAAVFELFIPLNPRPKIADITNAQNGTEGVRNHSFSKSPPKIAFHATPSLPSFNTVGIQPVPMSPSINTLFPSNGNVPTHSTPAMAGGVVGHSMTMVLNTRSREQVDACRRNFSQHNQTMSLDTGTSAVIITAPTDEPLPPPESASPVPGIDGKGEKLNRTFTKADLILMKNNNAMEQTVTRFSAESDDESAESLSCGHPETLTSSSSAEQVPSLAQAPAQLQEHRQTSLTRPVSQLPAPSFTSRLMQPKVYPTAGSNPSLVGSASSLASNNSSKPVVDGGDLLGPPAPLTRAGTFTKDSRAPTGPIQVSATNQAPPKKSIGVVLPNKMSAPRPSVAPSASASMQSGNVRRNNTAGASLNSMVAPSGGQNASNGQSMNVHAYRYPSANAGASNQSSRPSTAGGLVRKSNAAK